MKRNLFVFFIFLAFLSSEGWTKEMLQEANAQYLSGIHAKNYSERKLAFNRALSILHGLLEADPESPFLNQAYGDVYYQLGEFPWAILYYQRALKYAQGEDPLLLLQIKEAQRKLGLKVPETKSSGTNPFFDASRQFSWLLWIVFFTFLASSLAIWLKYKWVYRFCAVMTVFLALFMGNMLFFYYFKSQEGILIKTAGLYRGPDWNQPQMAKAPISAGSQIQILQMTSNGDWLKVKSPDGLVGYIPITHVRLI